MFSVINSLFMGGEVETEGAQLSSVITDTAAPPLFGNLLEVGNAALT